MSVELVNFIKENFYKRLEKKTGWGRNEIKKELEQAITESVLKVWEKDKLS